MADRRGAPAAPRPGPGPSAPGPRPSAPGPRPSAAKPPDPSVRRPPSIVGIVIVATAGLVALWVTIAVFLPVLGELGNAGRNPAALPRTLEVCDHTWDRGATTTRRTLEEVVAREGGDPVVVTDSGPGVCPAGACVAAGADAASPDATCATVVYVKTGDDAYVPYELVTDQ
jgi:hypothetical protein